MAEWLRAILIVVFMVTAIASGVMWVTVNPSSTVVWMRIATTSAGCLAFGWLLWGFLRKEKLPDLLGSVTNSYFERNGLCFAMIPTVIDGCSMVEVYFQNRFSKPCKGEVYLYKPGDRQPLIIPVHCAGTGFGVTRMQVPQHWRGCDVKLSVYASVHYPTGRGRMMRFRDGIHVGDIDATFRTMLTVAAACTGSLLLQKAATIKMAFLADDHNVFPEAIPPTCDLLWEPELAIAE